MQIVLAVRGLGDDALASAEAIYRAEQKRRGGGGEVVRMERASRDMKIMKRVDQLRAANHAYPIAQAAAEFEVTTRTISTAYKRAAGKT